MSEFLFNNEVISNRPWLDSVMVVIDQMRMERASITSDDVRSKCEELGIKEPSHPNAWGAVMVSASAKGLISRTNETKTSERKKSKSRRVPVWNCIKDVYGSGPLF